MQCVADAHLSAHLTRDLTTDLVPGIEAGAHAAHSLKLSVLNLASVPDRQEVTSMITAILRNIFSLKSVHVFCIKTSQTDLS